MAVVHELSFFLPSRRFRCLFENVKHQVTVSKAYGQLRNAVKSLNLKTD